MADPMHAEALSSPVRAMEIRGLEPLAGRYASGPGVTLRPIASRAHLSLRAHTGSVAASSAALGVALPDRAKTSVVGDDLAALWLGPQDWLIVGSGGNGSQAAAFVAAIESAGVRDQSAVDVSDRYVGIAVEGPAAEAVLSAGCPQDLRPRSFPVGAVSRSILSKADVVIWRRDETAFEVLCVRSFADYVWGFLAEASRAPAV